MKIFSSFKSRKKSLLIFSSFHFSKNMQLTILKFSNVIKANLDIESAHFDQDFQIIRNKYLREIGFSLNESLNNSVIEMKKISKKYDILIKVQPKIVSPFFEINKNKEIPQEIEISTDFKIIFQRKESTEGLFFECFTENGKIVIERFMFDYDLTELEKEIENKSLFVYKGPEFYSLDNNIQHYVYDFLKGFSINNQLGALIDEIASAKETELYINWLKDIYGFAINQIDFRE